jgi:hypothetical protein
MPNQRKRKIRNYNSLKHKKKNLKLRKLKQKQKSMSLRKSKKMPHQLKSLPLNKK